MRRKVSDDPVELVKQFAESAIKQDEAVQLGDAKAARFYGRQFVPIAKRLVHMGPDAIDHFATLYEHPYRRVRVLSAVYLISHLPERTLAVLRELAKGDDFPAHCARLRIKEWEEHPEHYDEINWV